MLIDVAEYTDYLEGIYQRQLRAHDSPYLSSHSATRAAVQRQVLAAQLYLPFVGGRVLDWGCYHAPDACVVRKYLGPEVEIFGCDTHDGDSPYFAEFHRAAGLRYRQVEHPYAIPFEDEAFDTVIGDGVLEHVPNDSESLKELYRVLKPNGLLVISCLPNRWSYIEAIARWFDIPHHLRTYTMTQARRLLLSHGFEPFHDRYLQLTPTLSGLAFVSKSRLARLSAAALWKMNWLLETLWPVRCLASNLFLLARKRTAISWAPGQQGEFRARMRAAA